MRRSDPGERGRLLEAADYARLRQAFRERPHPVYRLRSPWLSPCALGELHTVSGALQAVTLIYGPWDIAEAHIRLTTWHDLPGQDFVPDAPADLAAAPPGPVDVDIDGAPTPGTLAELPEATWLLRADQGPVHLLASGRGRVGELAFTPLTDLEPPIEARIHHLAAQRPHA
jgi:hypothetical protein